SKLLSLAERNLDLGFGILLLFVVFEFGFVGAAFIFAEPVLHALTWPAILIGNLMAAAVMATYFLRRRPNLMIQPCRDNSPRRTATRALFRSDSLSAVCCGRTP